MNVLYFLGFLIIVGLIFWSVRKKFSVSEEDLILKKFGVNLINRGIDLVFLVVVIYATAFLFGFFGPEIERLDNTSFIKFVVVIVFLGVIFTSIGIFLKNKIDKKEMIFIYGIFFLIFALIFNAKMEIFPDSHFYSAIKIFIGALFAVWFCLHWTDTFQSVFALPVGFLILSVGFLWSGQTRTGSTWREYLQEPEIIFFLTALFVLQVLFYYVQEKWRRRIGYWGFMFPTFLFIFFQGLAIVLLLQFGNLTLDELAFRREGLYLNTSVPDAKVAAFLSSCDYTDTLSDYKRSAEAVRSGTATRSQVAEIDILPETISDIRKEADSIRKKYNRPDDSLFWAFKKIWQDIVLPILNKEVIKK